MARGALAMQVLIGKVGDFASAWRAHEETLLDEVGFVNLLNGADVFAKSRGDSANADGTAMELVDEREQNLVVDFVQSVAVDVERFECVVGDVGIDVSVTLDLGEVAHAPKQGVGDARRSAAA